MIKSDKKVRDNFEKELEELFKKYEKDTEDGYIESLYLGGEAIAADDLKSKNIDWGFSGTMSTNYGLSRKMIADLFNKVVVEVAKVFKTEKSIARDFLDSRAGRHLADALSFFIDKDEKGEWPDEEKAYIFAIEEWVKKTAPKWKKTWDAFIKDYSPEDFDATSAAIASTSYDIGASPRNAEELADIVLNREDWCSEVCDMIEKDCAGHDFDEWILNHEAEIKQHGVNLCDVLGVDLLHELVEAIQTQILDINVHDVKGDTAENCFKCKKVDGKIHLEITSNSLYADVKKLFDSSKVNFDDLDQTVIEK